jgi:CrcB protein
MPEPLRLFIAVGFLGALTTFSTFALDAGALLQRQSSAAALAYIALSVVLSLLAFAAAHMLASAALGRGAS